MSRVNFSFFSHCFHAVLWYSQFLKEWRLMDFFVVKSIQPLLNRDIGIFAMPVAENITSNVFHAYSDNTYTKCKKCPYSFCLICTCNRAHIGGLHHTIIKTIGNSGFHFSAAALLRMMSHFLTEDVFRNGLIKYFRAQLVSFT